MAQPSPYKYGTIVIATDDRKTSFPAPNTITTISVGSKDVLFRTGARGTTSIDVAWKDAQPNSGDQFTIGGEQFSWPESVTETRVTERSPNDWANNVSATASAGGSAPGTGGGRADRGRSGSSTSSGRTAAPPAAATAPEDSDETLAKFLIKHIDFVFTGVQAIASGRYGNAQALKAKISTTPSTFGPAPANGVAGFANQTNDFTLSNSLFSVQETTDITERAKEKLGQLEESWKVATAPDWNAWGGLNLVGLKFANDQKGLVRFLKFCYVLSHSQNVNEANAAVESMGLGQDQEILAWLSSLGLLGPFSFMKFVGPDGSNIPNGSVITFTPGLKGDESYGRGKKPPAALSFTVPQDSPNGYPMTLSAVEDAEKADLSGEDAKRVYSGLNKDTLFILKIGDSEYRSIARINYNTVVTFQTAAKESPAGEESAESGRTQDIETVRLTGGSTTMGGFRNFRLENKYVTRDGNVATRELEVQLRKNVTVSEKFTLTATEGQYILVPLSMPGVIKEAHWVIDVLGGASAAKSNVRHLVVREIVWTMSGRYSKVGGTMVSTGGAGGEYRSFVFEESDVRPVEQVSIVKQNQIGENAAVNAIRDYLVSNSNPVGEALIINPSLNNQINSFPLAG